jgi:ABC-type multidrug transport system, ATPase and permease components
MEWIFKLTKHKIRYYFCIFLMTIGDLSSIIPPILFGNMIDEFILNGDNANIEIIGFKIFLTILLGATSSFCGVIMVRRFRTYMYTVIRGACYEHLNELDRKFHYGNNIGEITTMITTDLNSVGQFVAATVNNIAFVIISFSVVFVYCLFVNVSLTIMILLPGPLIGYLSMKHMKKIPKFYDERREQRKRLNDYISEILEGIKVTRVLATEKKEKLRLQGLNSELTKKALDLETIKQKYNIKVNVLSESMNLILIIFGGFLLIKDVITLGELVMFRSFMWIMKEPFLSLAYYMDDYQEYKLSSEKIKQLLGVESHIKDNGKKKLNYKNEEIVFNNVTVRFDDLCAIRGISLKIKPGTTVACIGEVASGKSTIANLLLRFVEPTEGEILIGGVDYKKFKIDSLRDIFGYVSQTPFLYSDTIKNNVNYGNLDLTDEEIIKYLKMAKADYVFDLEDGINTIIGENGVNLSGGEKQRLSLARALAKNPSILILDDITSALDIETEVAVTENIEKLPKKITKIIIAQKVFSVKNADQILVFKNNEIVEMGTHQELLDKNSEYKKINDLNEGGDEDGN